jgi:hypothetical protein
MYISEIFWALNFATHGAPVDEKISVSSVFTGFSSAAENVGYTSGAFITGVHRRSSVADMFFCFATDEHG